MSSGKLHYRAFASAILRFAFCFERMPFCQLPPQYPVGTIDVSKGECLKLAATLKKVSDLPVSCRQYDDVVKIVEDNMNPYAGADRSVVSEAKIQRRLTTRRLTKKKDRFE